MKAMWETPRVAVETFAPNEYVSVCYELACTTGSNNKNMPVNSLGQKYSSADLWGDYGKNDKVTVDGQTYWLDGSHNGACTNADKNAIRVDENGNTAIWESSNWGENLSSVVTYQFDTNGDGKLGADDLFAWVTFSNVWHRFWRHWATAGALTDDHPNRS
ncbi:MAG: hypothetical protein ACI4O4_02335 [Candidatus Ventricola sp.]